MKNIINFLREWAVNYARNKDILAKTIIEIKEHEAEVDVKHKHKEQKYFIDPFLESCEKNLKSIKEDSHASIVCFNTKDNFRILSEKWGDFVNFRHLNLIFLNPFSNEQKVWVIFPHTHNNIADPDSLKLGLQTMFEQVEPIERKRIEEIYK